MLCAPVASTAWTFARVEGEWEHKPTSVTIVIGSVILHHNNYYIIVVAGLNYSIARTSIAIELLCTYM